MKNFFVSLFWASFSLSVCAKGIDAPKWDVNNPPGEAHTVNIDVSEGTWMNVDISPDGSTLVFDLLGDLYLLPIHGGEAKALTHSIAWEMQPKFSPDGSQIAFTSDQAGGDNIWIMNKDGTNQRQLTQETFRLLNSPVWSPDGEYIAAKKHFTSRRSLGAGEIWLYHVAGGTGLQLNKRPNDQKDLGEPAFSADGSRVYFSRDSTQGAVFEYSKDSNKTIYEIFSIDRSTGNITTEVSGMGGSIRPTPSPDGQSLAFVRRIRNQSSLFIKDFTTGIEKVVYQHLDRDMQETWAIHGVYPSIAWTPDSKSMVFWAQGHLNQLDLKTLATNIIPFHVKTTKSIRKAVTAHVDPAPEQFHTKMLRWVQVSPDGKQLVYQTLGHLYIKDLASGKVKRLTKQEKEFEFYPSYSHDGRWIVYTTWNDQKQGSVKKIRSHGGHSSVLTNLQGKYISPTFSQDDKKVVYEKVTGGYITSPQYDRHPGVYWVDASAKNKPNFVTEDGSHPLFSKNDERIFLHRYADNKSQLVSVNILGTDERIHVNTPFTTEFSLSPSQDKVAFHERYQWYVAPFTDAAKAIELSPKADDLPILKISGDGGRYLSWNSNNSELYWSLGSTLFDLPLPEVLQWSKYAKGTEELAITQSDIGFDRISEKPKGKVLLRGAQIITMQGDKVISKGDLLIEDNHISAIAELNGIKEDKNTQVIDVSGKTIMPGIVDVHWHGSEGSHQLTPQQNWVNMASLAFGVTTIHDPSNDTAEVFSASELQKAGEIVAPRIFSTGTILYGAEASITAEINTLDDALHHLKRLKSQGAFSIKSYNQPRREQRQQVLEAARQTHMMVVPEGGSTLQHNLTMIVDGHTGIEHAIPAAVIYDDIKQLWSQSQTSYTPTLVVAYGGIWGENYWYQHTEVWKHPLLSRYVPKEVLYPRSIRREMAPEEDYNHFKTAKMVNELQQLGVKVHLGAHGQREGLGAHWEMWMMAQGGMSPLNIIRAATLDGAKYLGMDAQIGSIEVGKLADLAILDADPLQNIYLSDKVAMVMVNGRLYDSKTLNEIGNHPQQREKLFFEKSSN